jgi:hypothetical protein
MGIPARPRSALHEGPDNSCVIDGKALGWTNCTPTSVAMAISKTTLGAKNPTPCDIRRLTGDTIGGTGLQQCVDAGKAGYGVGAEVHAGSSVCTAEYLAGQLKSGRGAAVQGNTGALLRTAFRCTGGNVNHCVWFNEGRGWHADANGHSIPTDVLVYDPAADGRTAGWGKAATSPQWWPWALVKAFVAGLQPWGEQDDRILGSGKVYCAIYGDTEPHVHLRFTGSARTAPFPRTLTAHPPVTGRKVNVRSGPSTRYPIVKTLALGTHFTAYQQNPNGALLAGSRLWYGDHDGRLWVHSSGLR